MFVARFSFCVLASLIFVIHFAISVDYYLVGFLIFAEISIIVHRYKQLIKTFRGYPQFYTLSSILNSIQKENIHLIPT